MATTKKQITELTAGDMINPPSHERGWLWKDGIKRQLTVVSVGYGRSDKRGPWSIVNVTYPSPYADSEVTSRFKMRPTSTVKVNGQG